jgi:hypothetical protein
VVELEAPLHVYSGSALEGAVPTQTSDQFLDSNMPSLSMDLVTLRERWFYVDDAEPELSADYAGVFGSSHKRFSFEASSKSSSMAPSWYSVVETLSCGYFPP